MESTAQSRRHEEECMVCLLEARRADRSASVYFSCDGESITYSDLWERAGRIAAGLRDAGVGAGDVVATLGHNSVEHLCISHACLQLGAVWAPLNVSLQHDDLDYSVTQLRPRLFIVEGEFVERHSEFLNRRHDFDVRVMGDRSAGEFSALATRSDPPDPYHWNREEWSWVIYSGATTGRPKAIMLPHAFAVTHARRVIAATSATADDVFFSVLQMCHGWLNFPILTTALVLGARVAVTKWFSASRWLDQVRTEGATIVDPFLPMTGALMAQPERPDDRGHTARLALGAYGTEGEADCRRAFEERFGIPTLNIYGVTETGALVSVEPSGERRFGSAGRVTKDYQVAILDPATGDWTDRPGIEGEILVRPNAPGLMALGYLGDMDRTVQTWRDLWVHTGDLGYFDADGYLYFQGRQAHWIRRKGENMSVAEVEAAIESLGMVAGVAVMGVPSPFGDEEVFACVVPRDGQPIDPALLHVELQERLAFFKVPRFIHVIDEFPRTVKGEVDRKALKSTAASAWDAGERAVRRHHTR